MRDPMLIYNTDSHQNNKKDTKVNLWPSHAYIHP